MIIAHIAEDKPRTMIDAIIALTYFEIAAQAFGVGTCWVGAVLLAFQEQPSILEYLNLPKGRTVVFPMLFGYPQYTPQLIPRRNLPHVTWR